MNPTKLIAILALVVNTLALQAQNFVVRIKGVPVEVENILTQKDSLKENNHQYLYFKIKNIDQAKKITETTFDFNNQTMTIFFPNFENYVIRDLYGWASPDSKWAIVYGDCEVIQPDNICNDPIYLVNLSTGVSRLISVDNRSLHGSPTKDLERPVSGFNLKSEHCVSIDSKGLHGWDAATGKEIWKKNIRETKEVYQMPGTDNIYVIYEYKRAQECIMVVQTSTGKILYEDKTGTYNIKCYYDEVGNSLYYKCPMESYCKKISMNTYTVEKTFYNNIIPFDEISFYGNRKWVRFSNGTDNVMFNTVTGERLNWSNKMANYSFIGVNSDGEESVPFYVSEFMLYYSDEFWFILNRKTGHFFYENKFGNTLNKFTIYKDSLFVTDFIASHELYDKALLSHGFTEDGKARLVERMAKLYPKIVNSNFLYLLDPLTLDTKDRIVKAMKKNIAGWAFVDEPLDNNTNQKEVKKLVISYPAGVYCIPIVMRKESTGIGYSVSYACIYVQVTTNSPHNRDEIIIAAKQVILKEYSTKLNGYNDYDVMFFDKSCTECKDLVNAKYLLSDFQVTFTTLP